MYSKCQKWPQVCQATRAPTATDWQVCVMPQTCFYSKMAINDISMYNLWLCKESDSGQN